jgi:quinoprotein glucose dehydrogenase
MRIPLSLALLPCLALGQTGWPTWSGGNDGNRYSPLNQINASNVAKLKPAWEFRSGDADARGRTAIQCTPIVVDGVLYATTPTLMAVALDAATGKELWRFEAKQVRGKGVNRGVMYWAEKEEKRILYVAGTSLFALDAKTGKSIPGFGANGVVDLSRSTGRVLRG